MRLPLLASALSLAFALLLPTARAEVAKAAPPPVAKAPPPPVAKAAPPPVTKAAPPPVAKAAPPPVAKAEPLPAAKPTTQACLGELPAFLACPAGAAIFGTQCRQRESQRSSAGESSWGGQRQGPSLSLFPVDLSAGLPKGLLVNFAARFKNDKKNGRVFRFDQQGHLISWENRIDDMIYGLSVTCTPAGTVSRLASYFNGKSVGTSRSWRADGTFSHAITYDANGKAGFPQPTPELVHRPDELCRPARCDIAAKPDLSAMPQGLSVPATP